ncbi:MAG: hypothetical protein KDD35_03390, partial [Bdellovibrionales bacterium]|nr:hypothetical protein [Bdellovibrionales bacterium]
MLVNLIFCLFFSQLGHASQSQLHMKDLQALQKSEDWGEILYKAKQISPSERDLEWQKIVQEAARNTVGRMLKSPRQSEDYKEISSLLNSYDFLKKDQEFIKSSGPVVLKHFEKCYQGSSYGDHCGDELMEFLNYSPDNHEFAFSAAQLVAKKQGSDKALPVFIYAFTEKSDSDRYCDDSIFIKTFNAAMKLPHGDPKVKMAQSLARKYCFKYLEEEMISLLESQNSKSVVQNICPVL